MKLNFFFEMSSKHSTEDRYLNDSLYEMQNTLPIIIQMPQNVEMIMMDDKHYEINYYNM